MDPIPVRVKHGGVELLVAYIYHLGPGQWFVATIDNAWTPPRYAKRICNY